MHPYEACRNRSRCMHRKPLSQVQSLPVPQQRSRRQAAWVQEIIQRLCHRPRCRSLLQTHSPAGPLPSQTHQRLRQSMVGHLSNRGVRRKSLLHPQQIQHYHHSPPPPHSLLRRRYRRLPQWLPQLPWVEISRPL